MKIRFLPLLISILILILIPARASEVHLQWDATASANIASYMIYYGPASRGYTATITLPATARTATILDLPLGRWYFAATARNTSGLESDISNEVGWTNHNAGLKLRITQAIGTPTTLEGSDDLRTWQTLAIIPQGGPPVTLTARPQQTFRARTAIPPLPSFTAAAVIAAPAPTLKLHKQRGMR